MRLSARGWLGKAPNGILLEFEADLSRPMGIAFERCLHFEKEAHAHERMVICAARGATQAEIRDEKGGKTYRNHEGVVVVKPPGFYHSVRSKTVVYDDLALLPTPKLVRDAGQRAHFSERQVSLFLSVCREVNRSAWLEQLLQQYFVRRILQKDQNLEFFEHELLCELMFLSVGHPERKALTDSRPISGPMDRALAVIEAELFSNLSIDHLARESGMSQSTLLRLFKSTLGKSPQQYLRDRRLDEAHRLLEKGQRSVLEVAQLVGYNDASAFSRAYRARFGRSPRR